MTEQDMQSRLPRLLDKDLNEVCRLRPNAQSIELNISPLSSASLTLEDGSGVAIRAFVELYNAKGSVGIFRVSRPDESYGSGERISLEHGICVLDDAIVQGKGEIKGTPTYVIGQILSHQKTKADGKYLWALGTVAAPDSMTIKVEHDGTKTLEMLSKAMRDLEGYMLTFDQSAVPWVMNVVKKPDSVACEGRLSRNIRTIRKTMDDGDLCTRLYCSLLDGGYIESDTIGIWGEVEESIVARVEDNVNKIKTQNTALLDLKADTESATAVLSAQVADNTALIRATADDLGSEIELKADKITLNGYVTANALKAELANFELSLNDSITTRTLNVTASTTTESLHANTCSTSNLRVNGNGISLKSATVLLSSTSLTVNSTGGTVTGVNLNKKTDTLYYMSWE